jgi:hypothetical protein
LVGSQPDPSGAGLTVAAVSEPSEARGAAANVVRVPVDLVEFEARLLALERRAREQEARDEVLVAVAKALRRLTEALGPLLEVVGPLVESQAESPHAPPAEMSRKPLAPQPALTPAAQGRAVEPERLAAAQARLLAMAAEAAQPSPVAAAAQSSAAAAHATQSSPTAPAPAGQSPSGVPAPAGQSPSGAPAPAGQSPSAAPALAEQPRPVPAAPLPAPGRRSWLLRALRRMAASDPDSAGRLLVALLPANHLAQIGPVPRLPGPPPTVARVVVKGRLRRRLGWELAQLACELTTVSALARLVRLRASPTQLQAAGVRLDSPLTLALVANTIDPRWTLGHRFTLAHLDASATYLEVRNGSRPAVRQETAPGCAQTTVRCSADVLLPLLAGEPGVVATVEGESRPLELVQGWFADATSA